MTQSLGQGSPAPAAAVPGDVTGSNLPASVSARVKWLRKAHLPLTGHLSPGHLQLRAPLQKEHDVLLRVGSTQGQTPELTPKQVKTCWVKQVLGISYFLFAKVCKPTS